MSAQKLGRTALTVTAAHDARASVHRLLPAPKRGECPAMYRRLT